MLMTKQNQKKIKNNPVQEEKIRNSKDFDSSSRRISGDWFDSAIKKDLPHITKGKELPRPPLDNYTKDDDKKNSK